MIETIIESAKDTPMFAPTMMLCAVLMALAYISKNLKDILYNFKAISKLFPARKSFKALIQAECEANDELNALVDDYGMDRAYLALFHNGRSSFADVCLLNLSVKAEGSSGREPKLINRMQVVPMLPFGNWMRRVSAGADVIVSDIRKAQSDVPDMYPVFEQNNVKSLYILPVVAPKSGVDGCVFIEYCREQRALNDIELNQIRARSQAIYTKLSEANNL